MTKSPNDAEQEQWKLIGEVFVDTGQIVILDPCNLDFALKNKGRIEDLVKLDMYEMLSEKGLLHDNMSHTDARKSAQENGYERRLAAKFQANEHGAAGIISHTGLGDGGYPVYAQIIDIEGFGTRVAGLWIDFEVE
jgi:hypothetical protein